MNYSPREDAAGDVRGLGQGTVPRSEARIRNYRPRRPTTSYRGLIVILALAVALVAAGLYWGIPAAHRVARDLAEGNQSAINYPLVGDLLKGELGDKLTKPAGTDATVIPFTVQQGDSIKQIAVALTSAGLIAEPLVFQFLVVTQDIGSRIQTGEFNLNKTMTPQQIVDRLLKPPEPPPPSIAVEVKVQLRIEQIAAKLETIDLQMSVKQWYDYVTHPPADLIASYPFLASLPNGRSLEGFLGTGKTYSVAYDITPEAFTRMLLDQWQATNGPIYDQVVAKNKNFYDLLTLASIVEREYKVESEKPKIAGVYANRLKGGNAWPTRLMNADPTLVYANDTMELRKLPFDQWHLYSFWGLLGTTEPSTFEPSSDLVSYQTYTQAGLPDGPIDSPSASSLQAALNPDTSGGFYYFSACPGDKKHKFAKTYQEHLNNVNSC